MRKTIQIQKNEFPVNAKSLGRKLLSYVLDIDEAQLETLMREGGQLDAERSDALSQLDLIMFQVKKGRINNQVLEEHDRLTLPGFKYQDGSFPFQKLRDTITKSPIEFAG